ncbi:PadR family transcriptional regulator [Gorillibacterium sp. sgz5001074]|uniref:PadR family transcriptional regulator n=1 Tax=Gorillibacterium sp. sgz5001074 TaxID=3446695 RepID=UPI003F67143C
MNPLAYGLLSLIAIAPCTGYDLTQRIQLFWNAKHSQIYPLLAQLEEQQYVRHEHVAQADKPDKKIYTITEQGRAMILGWLLEPTDPPVHRDEFSLKVFSLWLADRESVRKLLQERENLLMDKLSRLRKRQVDLARVTAASQAAGSSTEAPAAKEGEWLSAMAEHKIRTRGRGAECLGDRDEEPGEPEPAALGAACTDAAGASSGVAADTERVSDQVRAPLGVMEKALKEELPDVHDVAWPSPFFGASILIRKAILMAEAELEWCRGILEQV